MQPYSILGAPAEARQVIKRSTFIARLLPVSNEEEAAAALADVKKRHYDARHNCSCLILGKSRDTMRSSDDGEPSGTAGKPMLEVLLHSGLTDTLAVVTRYFGGVLLGAGGLLRAYSGTLSMAVANASITDMLPRKSYRAEFSFKAWARAEGALRKLAAIEDIAYAEGVSVRLLAAPEAEAALIGAVTELTGGTPPIFEGERYQKCLRASRG